MNPSAFLTRNLSINVVDVAVRYINVLKNAFAIPLTLLPFSAGRQHPNTKELTLVLARAIGIGDLQSIDLPKRRIFQKDPSRFLSFGIDSRSFFSFTDTANSNRRPRSPWPWGANMPLNRLPF